MARPQKSVVYAANASALGAMAQPLRDVGTTLMDSAEGVRNTIYDFEWEGHTKTDADDRGDREVFQTRAIVVAADDLADAYDNGSKSMQPMIESLTSKAQGLEGANTGISQNFAVSEDWEVTDTYDYDAARMTAQLMGEDTSDVDALQARRANEAATETANLQRLADELGTADENTRTAVARATAELAALTNPNGPQIVLVDDTLAPGGVRNLGPVAGTGANPGIPGIGAADLGEVVTLPNGKQAAIFGDSFSGNKVGEGQHYPSVAVPVHSENGKMVIDGPPLTGPDGKNVLFIPPPQAGKTDTLPAGSIRMLDGSNYMMVAGTKDLNPTGGSWLTKVTNDPAGGWKPVDGSWRAQSAAPTQISGYQSKTDHMVYIAADSFDRSQPATMYRVDPEHVTDRDAWQPWTGNGWGTPGQHAASISQVNNFGELSFREVGGQPVLSGFNNSTGNTEIHVGSGLPASVFNGASTTVAQGGNWGDPGKVPQNYGGYILPGSTLDNMGILVSQWNTTANTPYVVEQFQVNPNR